MQKWLRLLRHNPRLLRKLTLSDWLLICEAVPMLTLSRLLVLLIPFRRTASLLGVINQETPTEFGANAKNAQRISSILRQISYLLPWRSMCFEQALAGMMMLKLRRLDGTIYFGVQKDAQQMKAHAWLRSGSQIITGAAGHERFTILFTVATKRYKQSEPQTN